MHAHAFICPASRCLLAPAFNPCTFKVIIDMYDLITIFLIVLGLFSVGLYLLLCFLLREVLLAFVVTLVCVLAQSLQSCPTLLPHEL